MMSSSLSTTADLFGWPEYVVFGAMLGISAAIGLYFFCTAGKSTSEFLLGNRNLGVFPVSASLIASFVSAIALLGTPAEIYLKGTQYSVIAIAYAFVMISAAVVYMPVFFELQVTSANEYLELRFAKCVRQLASVVFVTQMTLYMAIVVYAPAIALSQVTGLNRYGCVGVIYTICTFYTTVGGMKAVVWTDLFQVVVMLGAMIVVVVKGVSDVGGHAVVWNTAKEGGRIEFFNFDFDPRTRHTVWGLMIGGYTFWIYYYGVNQAQVQRYLSLRTKRKVYCALFNNLVGLTAIKLLCLYTGLVMYAKYSTCDPLTSKQVKSADQILPLFVMDTLGEFQGLPGLFVAGIFSGSLSTVSSGLNSLAAIVLEDFVRGVCAPTISDTAAQRVSKVIVVAFGLMSFGLVFLAEQLGGILQASLSIGGLMGGPMLGVFSLGMFFPWANWFGALFGTLSALAVSFWLGIGHNLAKARGDIVIPNLPLNVDGCSGNFTFLEPPTTHSPAEDGGSMFRDFYRVSYIWYSLIGSSITVVVGLFISLLTGPQDPRKLSRNLISPAVDCLVTMLIPQRFLNCVRWDLGADLEKKDEKRKPSLPGTQSKVEESTSAGGPSSRTQGPVGGSANLGFDIELSIAIAKKCPPSS